AAVVDALAVTALHETRLQDRACWEQTVRELEEQARARHQQLIHAQELVLSQDSYWAKEVEHAELSLELAEMQDVQVELTAVREEAAAWKACARSASEAVQRLEVLAGKEQIRAERLRGCALQQQSRCVDLERHLEAESAQKTRLAAQVQALGSRVAWRHQEAEQERSMWVLQRRELDRALEDARHRITEAEVEAEAVQREAAMKRDRTLRQLRAQFERQEAAIVASSGSAIGEDESSAGSPRALYHSAAPRRRRSCPGKGARSLQGTKVAALRSAIYRQDQEGKREIHDLQAEFFREQQQLSLEEFSWRQRHQRLSSQLRDSLISASEARHPPLPSPGTSLNTPPRLTRSPSELPKHLIDADGAGLEPRECLASSALEASHFRPFRGAASRRPLPALLSPCRGRSPSSTAPSSPSGSRGQRSPQTARQQSLRSIEPAVLEEELGLSAAGQAVQISHLRAELSEEQQLEARCLQRIRTAQEELTSAYCVQEQGIEQSLRLFKTSQAQLEEEAAVRHEQEFSAVSLEAEQAEQAYLRLRSALVEQCEQEESLHEELLAEQAEHRRCLVAELALSVEAKHQRPRLGMGTRRVDGAELGPLAVTVDGEARYLTSMEFAFRLPPTSAAIIVSPPRPRTQPRADQTPVISRRMKVQALPSGLGQQLARRLRTGRLGRALILVMRDLELASVSLQHETIMAPASMAEVTVILMIRVGHFMKRASMQHRGSFMLPMRLLIRMFVAADPGPNFAQASPVILAGVCVPGTLRSYARDSSGDNLDLKGAIRSAVVAFVMAPLDSFHSWRPRCPGPVRHHARTAPSAILEPSAPSAPSVRTEMVGRSVADEATQLAAQLQLLADAATRAATDLRPSPAESVCRSDIGVGTEVALDELRSWQESELLLASTLAEIGRLRSQVAASQRLAEAAQVAEDEGRRQDHAELASEASVALAPLPAAAEKAEARARAEAVAELRRSAANVEEDAARAQALDVARTAEEAKSSEQLKKELSAASARRQASGAEATEIVIDAKELAAASSAAKVLEAAEAAEARYSALEEEQAQFVEELATLRFDLKETKRFQHERVQDLEAQAKKLEGRKKRLEAERLPVRAAAPEAVTDAPSVEEQLRRLQQLNERLRAQEQEADEELKKLASSNCLLLQEGISERERCRRREGAQQEEASRIFECLDELAASEGSLLRDARQLRNRAALLQKQVAILDATATQTSLQLQEAEAAHGQTRQEEQATERRAEIIGWKLQVAETQLSGSRSGASASEIFTRQRERSGSESGGAAVVAGSSSSSSPAGTTGGAVARSLAATSAARGDCPRLPLREEEPMD
ncbi:unnamed protein product, partial [Polarella glacialis]